MGSYGRVNKDIRREQLDQSRIFDEKLSHKHDSVYNLLLKNDLSKPTNKLAFILM